MIQSNLEWKGGGAARYVVDVYHIVATINESFRRMIVLEYSDYCCIILNVTNQRKRIKLHIFRMFFASLPH